MAKNNAHWGRSQQFYVKVFLVSWVFSCIPNKMEKHFFSFSNYFLPRISFAISPLPSMYSSQVSTSAICSSACAMSDSISS